MPDTPLTDPGTDDADSFVNIEEKFRAITDRIAWCTVATVDRQGRPRSRILHPVWEGPTGYIATGRHSHKQQHLAQNPFVSLSYWDPQHEQAIIECKTEWSDDDETKRHVWELFKNAPEPVGYDPAMIWQTVENPEYGVLKLTPWRLSVWSMQAMASGEPEEVWRQDV